MKALPLCLLLAGTVARGELPLIEGVPAAARVDVWVFEETTPATALSAVSGALSDDALFALLSTPEPGRAPATLVARHRLTTGGRPVRSAGSVEEMYPTEFDVRKPPAVLPSAFEARNTGASVSFRASWVGGGLHAGVAAESVVRAEDTLWPGRWPSAVARPQFLTRKSECLHAAPPGKVFLSSLSTAATEADALTTRWVFTRVTPIGSPPEAPAPAPAALFRVKLAVFRLPLASTAAWLWERRPEDDATTLAELTEAAGQGTVRFIGASVLSGATGPLRLGAPPPTTVGRLAEFSYPTRYVDGSAEAFDTLVNGQSVSISATLDARGARLLARVDCGDSQVRSIRRWRLGDAASGAQVAAPEFLRRSWESQCALPANGTLFLGLEPVDGTAEVDALFLTAQTSVTPPPPEAEDPAARRVDAFVLSVTEAEASALREPDAGASAAWAAVEEGRGHVLSALSVTVAGNGTATSSALVRMPFPSRQPSKNELTFKDTEHGPRLSVRHDGGKLSWQTAPSVVPDAALEQLPGEAPIGTFGQSVSFPVSESGLQLVDVVPSAAPPDTPEHGRWHAVLVRVADE